MRELPILAKDSVALNISSGKQTQHRVPMKVQPPEGLDYSEILGPEMYNPCCIKADGEEYPGPAIFGAYDIHGEWGLKSPWSVGDLLYVREAWYAYRSACSNEHANIAGRYRADGSEFNITLLGDAASSYRGWKRQLGNFGNQNMFKQLARTWVKVNRVWVERVQDISAKDIIAEGMVDRPHNDKYLGKCPVSSLDGKIYPDLKSLWGHAWNSIYGKQQKGKPDYSWKANPWVWCCEFERVVR